MADSITFKSRGKMVSVEVVDDISAALKELQKLSGKDDDELLLKAGVIGCEEAARSAPKASKTKFPLGTSANPEKGGKGKKGSRGRFYYALMSKKGRKGTPLQLAQSGEKNGRYGYNRARRSIGYGRMGFLAARSELVRRAKAKGISRGFSPTRAKFSREVIRKSKGEAELKGFLKSVTVRNWTEPCQPMSNRQKDFQAALERGVKVGLAKYIFNKKAALARRAKQVSA